MKKLVILLLFFTAAINFAHAQKLSRKEYIKKYKAWAVKEMKRTGIPASITIAQGLLESNNGNSRLARKAKNHFGIKCHNWNGPSIKSDDDRRNECFRKYRSAYDSFIDHSNFLTTRSRYAFLFKYSATDYKRWAKGLKKAGYATNPRYAQHLIRIIEEEKLYRLDRGQDIKDVTISHNKSWQQPETEFVSSDPYGARLEQTNGVHYILTRSGDTFYSISKNLGISIRKLKKYNELSKRGSLKTNQRLYLGTKKRKAARGHNYHIVKKGETLYDISQLYCIRLKHLCKMNRVSKRYRVKPGMRIYLRRKKR